jgi:hypothetical protein
MITKVRDSDRDAMTTMSTTQQSFALYVVLRKGATVMKKAREEQLRLPHHNQTFMLSCAGCDDDHIASRNDQRRKYAEVKYGEYAKDGVYIAKGMYFAKGK